MLNLIGVYECRLDEKGRFMFPMALRKQLSGVINEGFIIKRSVHRQCLEIFPMQVWNKEMQEVNRLNRYIKSNDDFIRALTAGHRYVEIDGLGRLLIPKDLMVFAELKKDIVCATLIDRIELWDKLQYEAIIKEISINFGALAENVMGKNLRENDENNLS
ncbi:MAG TPA: hypothetical protein P5250_01095 [Bacteroidales bacterium]|nr:hypothetical protein [Bacteroidales bacterium]